MLTHQTQSSIDKFAMAVYEYEKQKRSQSCCQNLASSSQRLQRSRYYGTMQPGFHVNRKLSVSISRTKFSHCRRQQRNFLPNNRKGARIPQHLPSAQMASMGQGQRFPADASSRPDEKEGTVSLLRKLKRTRLCVNNQKAAKKPMTSTTRGVVYQLWHITAFETSVKDV